jgi:hypothetical protein
MEDKCRNVSYLVQHLTETSKRKRIAEFNNMTTILFNKNLKKQKAGKQNKRYQCHLSVEREQHPDLNLERQMSKNGTSASGENKNKKTYKLQWRLHYTNR